MRLGPLRPVLHRVSAPARAHPTFLVIGAQKSGTTSLRRYLVEHPAVLCAEPKELHYFDRRHELGDGWYLAQFPWKTAARRMRRRLGVAPAVGEATPEYLYYTHVPPLVHAFDPDLKLIVVLRDPIDRAYSHYQMQVRRRGERRTFEEVLALEEAEMPERRAVTHRDPNYVLPIVHHSYVERGFYAEQLERWFSLFPRDQFLILTSRELSDDPAGTMARVSTFLGVPECRSGTYARLSAGEYEPMAPETRERLASVFEPHNRRLEQLLGQSFDWTSPATQAA
jgi:lipopolysaccharide transport system ATP-binding protein